MTDFDLKEQLARIDRELATHANLSADTKFAAWKVAFAGMTAGAALFAAGGAFVTLLSALMHGGVK